MIAKNFIRYPEALRFQVEMFSNGYHNSPRLMRLMTVIFEWAPITPEWVKVATAKAKALVKAWKTVQMELFETMKKKAGKTWRQMALVLFPEAPERATKTATETPSDFKPILSPTGENRLCLGGKYASYCRKHQTWAMPRKNQDARPYWGGFSV